ncbi:hypothetical protein [Streptomyces sp. OK228]|uniref:hypothetical protein n=1 Tax=Streptomyces sp. OK228 TaxID=1882786 RepID=UPI000BDCB639|nr:hypothetical protein [Streptomyces sp. OK228]SOE25640.1 hypothetical protein SAMN05442782_2383 [Streptomyces sp. OK228]
MTMQGDLALMHANGATFAQMLDAHAHLLAEQIREGCNCLAGAGTCDVAAARIDPEVSDR